MIVLLINHFDNLNQVTHTEVFESEVPLHDVLTFCAKDKSLFKKNIVSMSGNRCLFNDGTAIEAQYTTIRSISDTTHTKYKELN